MKTRYFLPAMLLMLASSMSFFAQTQMFNSCVENEGENIQVTLPGSFNTANFKFPDPFKRLNGQRITTKEQWKDRRQEILKLAEKTVYGPKPPKPASVTGTVTSSRITVNISEGGKTTSFSVTVTIPSGTKPENGWPAVISYGNSGATSAVVTGQGVAYINYTPTNVAGETGGDRSKKNGAFFSIYGVSHKAGSLMAWAWGISRIIDVIESDPNKLFDPTAIGVTGCSRYGKGPFVAAAFDQRIALAMPMEGGSGGSNAMRVIAATAGAQSPQSAYDEQPWLGNDFGAFSRNVNNLPIDMHEVAAMIAPRGLLFLDKTPESSDWLCTQASNAAARGAAEVYSALGVGSNIQYINNTGGSTHCAWNAGAYEEAVKDFIQKYLKRTKEVSGNMPTFNVSNSSRNPNMANWIDWNTPTLSGNLNIGGCNSAPISGYTVSTSVSPAGKGSVSLSPEPPVSGHYEGGETVTLTAVASPGWKFDRWSGDVTGNLSPLTITMDANKSIIAKFVPTVNGTENLVKNGDFVNNQNWTLNTGSNYGGSTGTFSVSGGKATINITGTGTNPWEPQLVQQGISLEQDMKYRLTFDASVAEARDLEVLLQMAGSPYTTYLSTGTIALTNQTQSFSFEFEMTHPSDPNAQLAFNVGQSTQNVILSNIKLIYLADFTKTVTLTFDSQGGSTVTPGSITVEAGATIGTLPAEPHLAGYSFNGWYSLPDGNGTQYTASSTLTEDTVAYAMWTADIYTIEYDAEGGDAVPGGTYTIESDDIILPTATRRGYDFAGWQEPGSLTMETIIPTGSIGNRFYSAQWKVIEYDIIYVLDGGDNHPENPASYTVEDNIVLQDPVKENFEFTGWEEGNEIPEGSTGEKTFTATWASLTHISENTSALAFQIYPNPVTGGNFNVALNSKTAVFTILNLQGQVVFSTEINTGVSFINADLAAGVYVISVKRENEINKQKLIVK
jgi:uncharacterized repeat protein (TIGR02543 family)